MTGMADDQGIEHLLAGLDEAQRHAVTTPSALVAVLAAAGSGKTRVLTRRIAFRAATERAEPRHTLALTFTREAAGELRRRLRRLGLREPVEAGTFHAVSLGLLRQRWQDRGTPPPAIVNDRERLLRDADTGLAPAVVGPEADWAAAQFVPASGYAAAAKVAGRRPAAPLDQVGAALVAYEQLKQRRGVVDLDDLLRLVVTGLADDPTWRDVVHYRFRHVLVDEAQDLNPTQFRLLRLLTGDEPDLFLVGDPAQAIYGFNGADPGLLGDIGRHLAGIEIVRLPRNHRSAARIVDAARVVLEHGGVDTELVAARDALGAVRIHRSTDEDDEARFIAVTVKALDPSLVRHGHVGILARTNAQLPRLAAALEAEGVSVRRAAVPPGSPLATVTRGVTALPSASRLRAWAHDVIDAPPATAPGRAPTAHETAEREVAMAVLEFLREQPTGDGAGLRAWIATTNPFADGKDAGGVDLLTFHGAKGREWDTVVVTGAETGLVPHRSATTVAARAEEARLLHVALTRARESLIVTWAERRGGYRRQRTPLLAEHRPDPDDAAAAFPAALHHEPSRRDNRRRRLAEWRDHAARAAGVLPDAICGRGVLDAIEQADPSTPIELDEATGFGAITSARLYPAIRAALDG